MPQPAANSEAAQALIDVYRAAHESIAARIMDTFPPGQAPTQRRLRELLASVDAEMARLQVESKAWVEGTLPGVYQAGGQVAAAATGGEFAWTQAHLEAVQALAQRTFEGLLEATQFVATDTKQTIRAMARSETRRALLEGVTATKAGADMAKQVTDATGAVTVRYSNGARHSIADHADTAVRTETAQAYNEGTFVQASEDGFDWMEVFDGPDCGWARHDDPDKADGSVRARADCEEHPISHPRCARSFAPAVDVTSQADADAAGRFTPAEQAARSAAEQARVDAAVPKFTVAKAEAKAVGGRVPRRAARPARPGRAVRARRSG